MTEITLISGRQMATLWSTIENPKVNERLLRVAMASAERDWWPDKTTFEDDE